ncbi:porin family protein [Phenylobacterium sp.]|uniref:porin family protein n=1 Tax=Phenylobacterium sp. TaxID=1871053 RepID=UPI002F933419
MKTFTSAAVWAALALAVPAAAAAQDLERTGVYAGVGYSHLDPSGARDAGTGALAVRAGYQFNRFLGIEAEGSLGVDDGHFSTGAGARGSYGLDYAVGAFGVARYPVSERLDVFARGGAVHARFDGKARIGSTVARFSDKDEWLAAGAGAELHLGGANALRAEYTRYEGNDDLDVDVWGVSFVRRF